MTPALERHLVLHGVAVKRNGAVGDVAAVAGLSLGTAARWLSHLVETGRVVEANGGYVLTPLARLVLDGDYSRFGWELRADTAFMQAYDRFERINLRLKDLITEWQTLLVGGARVANDHSDKEHDDRMIDRLGDFHDHAELVLTALETGDPRFAFYRAGLSEALDKAEDGAVEWVSDARIASYHTLWFELHEDLLRIVGRERVE